MNASPFDVSLRKIFGDFKWFFFYNFQYLNGVYLGRGSSALLTLPFYNQSPPYYF